METLDPISSHITQFDARSTRERLYQTPTEELLRQGQEQALSTFRLSVREVPAFQRFLEEQNVNPDHVTDYQKFVELVPEQTKENYIDRYSLEDRCIGGNLDNASVTHSSSGTGGTNRYWPKSVEQEFSAFRGTEMLFEEYLGFRKGDGKSRMYLNALAMGPWPGGEILHAATKMMSWRGLGMMVHSPGADLGRALSAEKALSFMVRDQVIIGAYPSFMRDLIGEMAKKGNVEPNKYRLFMGGEKFSEDFRNYAVEVLQPEIPEELIIHVYGASETGVTSFSNPLLDKIRMFVHRNPEYSYLLYNPTLSTSLPTVTQVLPLARHVETNANGEILVTTNAYTPLIRYNSKDRGRLIHPSYLYENLPPNLVGEYVQRKGSEFLSTLPVLTVEGRSDQSIIHRAVVVFGEDLEAALASEALKRIIKPDKLIVAQSEIGGVPSLDLTVELESGVELNEENAKLIRDEFTRRIAANNSTYAMMLVNEGEKLMPNMIIVPSGDPVLNKEGQKGVIFTR